MRFLLANATIVVFSCGTFSYAQEKKDVSPERTLHQWAEALKSSKVGNVMTFYEDSEDVLLIVSRGHARKGTDAVRKEYEAAFAEVTFDRVVLDSLSVRQSGQIAWAVCRFKADTTLHADKSRWRLDIRTSFVLNRIDGTWKIVLEHSSPVAGVPRVQPRP